MLQNIIDNIIHSGLKDKIKQWNEEFNLSKLQILKKLKSLPINEIVDEFSFSNMKISNKEFCYLLGKDKPCHHINEDKLFCYACNCPHYQIEDSPYIMDNKVFFGKCGVQSKKAKFNDYGGKLVPNKVFKILDCSECPIPHTKHMAEKEISKDLNDI